MIVKVILKEVVVKTDLLLIVMQILKHVNVIYTVWSIRSVKKDIVACIV